MDNLFIKDLTGYHFEPGKILLNDQRYVLMGANALGTLKRDLIFALGVERTKGFMLRYGWNHGSDYAKKLKSMYPETTKHEWFYLGPKIHSHTGSLNVVPSQITYNKETGYYYAEGIWADSYEVEQHLKYFGISEEPVCFMATGYAGGYISELLERTALCIEVECRGKGDAHCRWMIKPLDEWDEEVQKEIYFYQEKNLDKELDRAYKRIEKQKRTLQKALQVNEELSRVLLNDNRLSSIVTVLGKNLNAGVMIEDKYLNILELFPTNNVHTMKGHINEIQWKKIKDGMKTVHLSITEGNPHERLVTPILVKNEIYGYISLIKEHGSFSEANVLSLERAAATCSIKLLNDMAAFEAEHRLIGNLLDELLNGEVQERNLYYRMNLMGYDIHEPHYLLLISLPFKDDFFNPKLRK
ncbi:XylR N-terminal domain-containing protein [Siminovitchia sp. 179-K 8D1 HS]|uniref:XylR N-terminal domain-containing protein n=1 Tax=Siminovitchia sp. 179-K 8D1 HS TaxID=3142385 RepID=UPI0039A304CA